MYEVESFKNFENSLTTVKVMTKTKVAPFYLGHSVNLINTILHYCWYYCTWSARVTRHTMVVYDMSSIIAACSLSRW